MSAIQISKAGRVVNAEFCMGRLPVKKVRADSFEILHVIEPIDYIIVIAFRGRKIALNILGLFMTAGGYRRGELDDERDIIDDEGRLVQFPEYAIHGNFRIFFIGHRQHDDDCFFIQDSDEIGSTQDVDQLLHNRLAEIVSSDHARRHRPFWF